MSVALGIDVAEERKGLDLVALAGDRSVVLQLAHAAVADVAAVIAGLRPDVVCIDSPPAWATNGRSRAAERQLRAFGITAYATPTDPGVHPFYGWMRVGFSIFAAIADDYPRFRSGPVRYTAAEVFPEASAVLLAGGLRPVDEPKSRFRRGVLANHRVDPSDLRTGDAVDAALAALTGLLALEEQFSTVGDPDEGVIVLPVRVLPSVQLVRPSSAASRQPVTASHIASSGAQPIQRVCLCGCGAVVRRRFLPGHDARLKSRLLRLWANGDVDAAEQLRALGWADPSSGH